MQLRERWGGGCMLAVYPNAVVWPSVIPNAVVWPPVIFT